MENIRGIAERNYSSQIIYEDFQPSSDWTHDSNCHVLLVDLPGFMKEEVKVEVDNLGKVMISGESPMGENKTSRFKQVFRVPEDSDIDKISGKLDGGLLFILIPKKTNEMKQEPKEKEELLSPNETKENKELEKSNNEDNQMEEDDDADKHEYHGNHLHDDMKEENERSGRKKGVNEEGRKENLSKEKERVEKKRCLEVSMETAMENIGKKKVVFVSVVVALSFGLYLSHKLRSGGQ